MTIVTGGTQTSTYSKFLTGKHSFDAFSTQNGLKKDDAFVPFLFNMCH
jgi:hypothetical protein